LKQNREPSAMKHICLSVVAAATLWVAPAQERLPKGEEILDRYIEVTGGKAAYEKLQSDSRTAKMEFVGKGVSSQLTIFRLAPNKSYTRMDMPGMGQIEEGCDGSVAWSNSLIQGPRIKEGEERSLTLLTTAFNGELRWRELFEKAEVLGVEDVGGQACYKVALTSKEGLKQTRFYDKKTGLLVKISMVAKAQMGDMPVDSTVSDYRAVDGILIAHKTTVSVLGSEMITTLESVKFNAEIDASRFQLPKAIQALLKKEKK